MRKWLLFFCLMMLVALPAQAQEEEDPRYALFYPTRNAGSRVVTNYGGDDWRSTEWRARPLFGTVRENLTFPLWTQDGNILYSTIYTPNSQDIATKLYGYFISSTALAEWMDLAPTEDGERQLVRLEALSPDDRYAWVRLINSQQTQLIDLENRALITTTECPATLLTWLANEAIFSCTGELFAPSDIFALELASGERSRLLLPPNTTDFSLAFPQQGRILPHDRYLVGSFTGEKPLLTGLLSLNEYGGEYFPPGIYLSINPPQSAAAYYSEGRLKRLTFDPPQLADLGEALPTPAQIWLDGETLRFWQGRQTGANWELIRVEATPQTRQERRLYAGRKPNRWLFSPDGNSFVFEFESRYVEVYRNGELIWVSDTANPNRVVTLPPDSDLPIAWTEEWLQLRAVNQLGELPETLSVNLETGAELTAVEASALYKSASPDGEWWLMTVSSPNNPELFVPDRLILYNWRLDQVVALFPDLVPLYQDTQAPDWMFYRWSPFIE